MAVLTAVEPGAVVLHAVSSMVTADTVTASAGPAAAGGQKSNAFTP